MGSLRFAVPAVSAYAFPIRHAHEGELILRAALMVEGNFTPTSTTVWYLSQYRGGAPVGSDGALGTLTWGAGTAVSAYVAYDFVLPATEGGQVNLQEDDVVIVKYTGPAMGFLALALSLG